MGCNLSGEGEKFQNQELSTQDPNYVYKKNYKLTKAEYINIYKETRLSKERINEIFDLFFSSNTKGYLDKSDFIELYCSLK